MTHPSTGRFVWHDYLTKDAKGAEEFYSHVVGWKTEKFNPDDHPGGGYTMWTGSQGPLGGIGPLNFGDRPFWTSFVAVEDLDATLAEVKKRDGRIVVPATPIPTVGRFAFIGDPQGAMVGVIQQDHPMPPKDVKQPGTYCWSELMTNGIDAAFPFYAAIFGWTKSSDFDMGPMGKYRLFAKDGVDIGGMMNRPKDHPFPPSWQFYVEVTDLDAALERAKSRGAKVLHGPAPVPGGARMVQMTDPQGAFFAMHEIAK